MVRLRYCEEIALNPGAGAIATYEFLCNDMRDPNRTGVGHQPMGFDQWCPNIYNHFCVVGSVITLQYAPTGAGSQVPCYLGVNIVDATGVTYANIEELLEQKFTRRVKGTVGASYHLVNDKRSTLKSRFSARKFFGTKVVGEDIYRGSSTQSPQEQAFFQVWAASVGGNDPAAVNVLVTIDYIAVLTEPVTFAQS